MGKKIKGKEVRTCAECANSYDWHEFGADGKPFLCRCKFYKSGKYSTFLKGPMCKNFKEREK